MAAPVLARRPVVSALLTVLALVALLRLRGPEEVVSRRAVRAGGPLIRAPHHPRATATKAPAATRSPRARATISVRTRPPTGAPTVGPRPKPSPTAPKNASYTGDTYDTPYGPVQVRMTVDGSRLTDVVALQLPNGSSRSREINGYAAPQLRQEALDAQSANIDTVSGATYTSDAYASSLQSAIDQWHP